MPTNYPNYYIKTLDNVKELVPTSANGTGTIETDGVSVIGTGTLFMTEMPMGSWLVDLSANEFRYVVKVRDNTTAYLSQAFTVDIAAGATPNILHQSKAYPCEISLVVPVGEADATVVTRVESTIPAGLPVSISKANRDDNAKNDLVNPCIVDATGTIVLTEVIY